MSASENVPISIDEWLINDSMIVDLQYCVGAIWRRDFWWYGCHACGVQTQVWSVVELQCFEDSLVSHACYHAD